jgi:3-hydroxy-3-methylglutaryl CoA synthase
MFGIVSYGAYVPLYRLGWNEIAMAWGKTAPIGEKAVANYDEDSVTMGVEAGVNCIGPLDRREVDGLYLATTTAPYREKQASSMIAAALDLRDDIFTHDCANSIRAGTIAFRAALDAVQAGSAKKALVISSDCRIGAPKSGFERLFGDGAAALLLGSDNPAVTIEGSYSISSEFMDIWRTQEDTFPRSWEERFVITEGYLKTIRRGVSGIMKKYKLKAEDFTRVVMYGPDPGSHLKATKSLGFNLKAQVQPPLFSSIGNTGSAFSLMMLVSALEEAKPGDSILFASYGDGCDTYILRVNENIENIRERKGVSHYLSLRKPLSSYERYLSFRDLVTKGSAAGASRSTFLPWLWRDRKQILSLYGSKCRGCSTIFFPIQRVCDECLKKDDFEEVRLSDKRGKVFTFNVDNLAPGPESPVVITIVDLQGGGRLRLEMTDCDPKEVKIGMDVELTFRKMHNAMGINHYFWKSRPLRGEKMAKSR